jgi:hypothetical protein
MPVLSRAHGNGGRNFFWLGAFTLVVACSGSDDINFFEPSDDGTGGATSGSGGTAGTVAGSDSGGSSTGGTTSTGGASGDTTGGTTGVNGGTAGDTGGTGDQGGTDPGAGTGGMPMGGTGSQGNAGSPMAGDGGVGLAGMGGTAGVGMGGAGMAGVGVAGSAMAGMGGVGMGGAGGAGSGGSAGCTPTNPSTERCDGIDNNCTGGVDEGTACPNNCTGATRAGHSYIFCSFESAMSGTRLRSWMQADDFCAQRNLGLVFIESAEENAFVLDWITRMQLEDQVWMGANDRDPPIGQSNEGQWVWGSANNAVQFWQGDENGMPVMNRYENWGNGEPNNQGNEDCGVFSANHGYDWDDRLCTNMYPNFVCESGVSITPN